MANDITKAPTTAVSVKEMLDKNKQAIMKSMPQGFNYDRMCRTVINAASTNPVIMNCTPSSIFLSTVASFSLGLEPNGALQEAYLIPFRNNKKGVTEAKFMPGYRGLIELARRSGKVSSLYAHEVCKNDEFKTSMGTKKELIHNPDVFSSDRGEVIGYYAVIVDNDGNTDFETMSIKEIEKIRSTSKSANNGPWVEWFDEMAKKTVLKRLLKRCPMSVEVSKATEFDHQASTGEFKESKDIKEVIDIEGLEVEDEVPPAEAFKKPMPKQDKKKVTEENPLTQLYINREQQKLLFATCNEVGLDHDEFKQWLMADYSIESSNNILKKDFEEILDYVKSKAVKPSNEQEAEGLQF